MTIIEPNNRNDLYRAILCFIIIVTMSILVGFGKIDVSVFLVIITGITSYYLGKSSDKGSLIN